MRADLWSDSKFVAAFDMPPFHNPPAAVTWNDGLYLLRRGEPAHNSTCRELMRSMAPGQACTCGGTFAYDIRGSATYDGAAPHVLQDMHKIEAPRDKPLTEAFIDTIASSR